MDTGLPAATFIHSYRTHVLTQTVSPNVSSHDVLNLFTLIIYISPKAK